MTTSNPAITESTPRQPAEPTPNEPGAGNPLVLRRIVAWDRIMSASSAASLLVGAPWIADVFDWSTAAVVTLGVVLVANTVLLHAIHRRAEQDGPLIGLSIGVDLAFAGTLGVVLVAQPDLTSTIGTWLLGATALFVLDVAIAKSVGLRRLRNTRRGVS